MNKNFELEGIWWLPETPDVKIFGVLSFTPGDVPKLKLMGVLNNDDASSLQKASFINPEIIHGNSSSGKQITLYKCLQTKSEGFYRLPGTIPLSYFIAHFVFIGFHFPDPSAILFSQISTRLYYLDDWYNIDCISTKFDTPDHAVIELKQPQPIEINWQNYQITIQLWEAMNFQRNKVSINPNAYITISKYKMKFEDEFLKLLRLTQNFFTFMITKPTFITEMTGQVAVDTVEKNMERGIQPEIKIYFSVQGWQSSPDDIFWAFMLFPYSEIKTIFPDIFKKWFEIAESIEPVINQMFAGVYQNLYLEDHFLNLAQAIETYHRLVHGGEYIPEGEYLEGLYKALIKAIPNNVTKDFRSSLIGGKLRYAHEYSLRKRISLICKHIAENADITFLNNCEVRTSFSNTVANTRNYLTHHSPELKESAVFDRGGLFKMNMKLNFILHFCILEQIGVPIDMIKNRLSKDRRFEEYFSGNKDIKM